MGGRETIETPDTENILGYRDRVISTPGGKLVTVCQKMSPDPYFPLFPRRPGAKRSANRLSSKPHRKLRSQTLRNLYLPRRSTCTVNANRMASCVPLTFKRTQIVARWLPHFWCGWDRFWG